MRHNFKNLKVWQRSMDLTDLIFDYCKSLPNTERYNLIDQINRSSCSIPSNIAEGSGKRTHLHFAEFLSTAVSSSYELQTQLLICQRRKYGNLRLLDTCLGHTEDIQRMLFAFRSYILSEESVRLDS
jgi:four helix bundle protein